VGCVGSNANILKIRRCSGKGGNSVENLIVDTVKIMAKGQITIPKEIRRKLGVAAGDRVTLVCDGEQVIMSNSVVYAMKILQKGMEGQANMVGLDTEEAVDALAAEVRGEVEGLGKEG
jgi:AbrB family looped-hinge helix DNA binding protein